MPQKPIRVLIIIIVGIGLSFVLWQKLQQRSERQTVAKSFSPTDPLSARMQKLAELATLNTSSPKDFDFGTESFHKVDEALNHLPVTQTDQERELTIQSTCMLWGAYVGETIRKHHGGEWSESTDGSGTGFSLKIGIQTIYPAAWCVDRIQGGASVWQKYQIFAVGGNIPR